MRRRARRRVAPAYAPPERPTVPTVMVGRPKYGVRPTSVGMLRRGGAYSVRDLGKTQQGYTDLVKRELGVSLRAEARYTQLHELSHVKHSLWSPKRVAAKARKRLGVELSAESILAAEDARINELLLRAVPDAHEGHVPSGEPLRCDMAGYVASHASPPEEREAIRRTAKLAPEVRAELDKMLGELAARPTGELTVWGVTVPLAKRMSELAAAPEPKPETGESGTKEGAGAGEGEAAGEAEGEPEDGKPEDASAPKETSETADEITGESGESAADASEPSEEAPEALSDEEALGEPDADGHPGCGQPRADGREHSRWIIPTVDEAKLTVPMWRKTNAAVGSSEAGTSLRWTHLHRIMTDGQVFRRVARRPGALQRGTCLIDVSGSMMLSAADLDRILELLPHATVALYAGHPTGKARVTVVARGGYRVADLGAVPVMGMGGNTCDGPALLWLSRQQRPLLWLCDGFVTGQGDGTERWMEAECGAIVQAAGIVQVCRYGGALKATARMVQGGSPGGSLDELPGVLRDVERGRVR